MLCPQCRSTNSDRAAACTMCGAPLVQRGEALAPALAGGPVLADDVLAGPSFKVDARAVHDPNELKRRAALAARFLVVALALFVALLVAILAREQVILQIKTSLQLDTLTPKQYFLGVGALALILNSLLIAYSARAAGANGLLPAAVGLLPPLLPAAFALLARRRVWLPFACLLADAVVLAIAWFAFTNCAWITVAVFVLMVPFVVYHLTGCAAVDLSQSLGLMIYVTIPWLCLAPAVLLGWSLVDIGALDLLADTFADGAHFPSVTEIGRRLVVEVTADAERYRMMFLVWFGVIILFWIKSVYENLKYPVLVDQKENSVWTS